MGETIRLPFVATVLPNRDELLLSLHVLKFVEVQLSVEELELHIVAGVAEILRDGTGHTITRTLEVAAPH